jgi:hypothetical protein
VSVRLLFLFLLTLRSILLRLIIFVNKLVLTHYIMDTSARRIVRSSVAQVIERLVQSEEMVVIESPVNLSLQFWYSPCVSVFIQALSLELANEVFDMWLVFRRMKAGKVLRDLLFLTLSST